MIHERAIVTAIFGEAHRRISAVSMPSIVDYACRIGATLVVLTDRRYPELSPYWEKFRIAELFRTHDRIAWIDADVIVNPTAPSIFEAAPIGAFSAFDEGRIFVDRSEQLGLEAPFYKVKQRAIVRWPHRYFNAGVMVLNSSHTGLLRLPRVVRPGSIMPEQTYLNLKLAESGVPCHDLTSKWNGLHSIHGPADRRDLHIVHYAGWPRTGDWVETMMRQMKQDLSNWKK